MYYNKDKFFDCSPTLGAFLILKHQKIVNVYRTKDNSWRFVFLKNQKLEDLIWQFKHIYLKENEEFDFDE